MYNDITTTTECAGTLTKEAFQEAIKLIPKLPEPPQPTFLPSLEFKEYTDQRFKQYMRKMLFPTDFFVKNLKKLHDEHLVEALMENVNKSPENQDYLIAYTHTTPNHNGDSYRVELRKVPDETTDGYQFYIQFAGSGFKAFLTNDEAYDLAHKEGKIITLDIWGSNSSSTTVGDVPDSRLSQDGDLPRSPVT